MEALRILGAGAARGLATALARHEGIALAGTFGAVDGILGKFLAGEPCDIVILTHAQVAQLTARNRVGLDLVSDLGAVRDSLAERERATVYTVALKAGAARELVFAILAEYGFTPEPQGTDADLADLDAGFLADGGLFDVAVEPDGSLVACCGMKILAGGRLELRKMYVRRDRRGQGLGRRLLDRALAWARARDYPRVELETATRLEEAIALYRKAGFVPRPGRPDTCRCDLAFELELS